MYEGKLILLATVVAVVAACGTLFVIFSGQGPVLDQASAAPEADGATTSAAPATTGTPAEQTTTASDGHGVIAGGEFDATALLTSHNDSLSGRSYRLVYEKTTENGDGTQSRATRTVRVDADGEVWINAETKTESYSLGREFWTNGSVALSLSPNTDRANVEEVDVETIDPGQFTGVDEVGGLLRAGAFEPSEGGATDGRTRFVAEVPTPNASEGLENVGRVRSFSGTLVVDDQGLVRRLNVSMTVVTDSGRGQSISVRYRVTELGSATVDRPEWATDDEKSSGRAPPVTPALAGTG